ncbi:MAG: D-glycero-beta-D-manno-heptose 1-phosphate adenylyltransferase [Thermodesulfobacteriota bacterium]|nr:D-glycero-beta-D-manno-heptose 1-phosphate adenylyltransferase [Thermodesulfobacteriota bacterium]
MDKVLSREELRKKIITLRDKGKKVVFTNGCFDVLHIGHVKYLEQAKGQGDILVLALNSDSSVSSIKGPLRPIVPQDERAYIMASLNMVDYVTIFDEDTPLELIEHIKPDILVKGGDWSEDTVIGEKSVKKRGGKVVIIPQFNQSSTDRPASTTSVIERILNACKGSD